MNRDRSGYSPIQIKNSTLITTPEDNIFLQNHHDTPMREENEYSTNPKVRVVNHTKEPIQGDKSIKKQTPMNKAKSTVTTKVVRPQTGKK